MNFDFSDAQKALKKQTRDFLKQACDPSVPRRILEGDEPYDKNLWQGLVDMESTGISIPEEYGGIGFGYLELCVVAEELGRALAPVPFSSSVYLATEALLQAGSEAQKKAYLPKLAAGQTIGTFAFAEGAGALTSDGLKTTFKGGKVTGAKVPVPDGTVADFAVVIADSGKGPTAVLVDLKGKGVSRQEVQTLDPSRSHASITFNGAAGELLGKEGDGWSIKDRVFDRAAVLFAMEQVGGADACLEMAVDYAKGRYAFGRPIGSFQAIKHKLADMYIKNELARANAYYGAWALQSSEKELPVAAAAARVAATEAYHYAAKENIQTHGGIGFTWEADCHLYYRRSKLLALALGSLHSWKDRLITALVAQEGGAAKRVAKAAKKQTKTAKKRTTKVAKKRPAATKVGKAAKKKAAKKSAKKSTAAKQRAKAARPAKKAAKTRAKATKKRATKATKKRTTGKVAKKRTKAARPAKKRAKTTKKRTRRAR